MTGMPSGAAVYMLVHIAQLCDPHPYTKYKTPHHHPIGPGLSQLADQAIASSTLTSGQWLLGSGSSCHSLAIPGLRDEGLLV